MYFLIYNVFLFVFLWGNCMNFVIFISLYNVDFYLLYVVLKVMFDSRCFSFLYSVFRIIMIYVGLFFVLLNLFIRLFWSYVDNVFLLGWCGEILFDIK